MIKQNSLTETESTLKSPSITVDQSMVSQFAGWGMILEEEPTLATFSWILFATPKKKRGREKREKSKKMSKSTCDSDQSKYTLQHTLSTNWLQNFGNYFPGQTMERNKASLKKRPSKGIPQASKNFHAQLDQRRWLRPLLLTFARLSRGRSWQM